MLLISTQEMVELIHAELIKALTELGKKTKKTSDLAFSEHFER